MATDELTIENAPRNAAQLLRLSSVQRVALFMLLCEDAETELEPGKKTFSEMEDTRQVDRLLELLMLYDQQSAGYTVVPLTLPVRTKQTKVNKERWDEFASALEEVLNDMRSGDFQAIQPIKFEEHGFLVIGYKSPPQLQMVPVEMPGPGPGMPGVGRPPGFLSSAFEEALIERKVGRLIELVKASHVANNELKRGTVDEIVQEEVKSLPAEAVRKVLKGLEGRMKAHEGAHANQGEIAQRAHTHELRLLKEVLEDTLRMQLC